MSKLMRERVQRFRPDPASASRTTQVRSRNDGRQDWNPALPRTSRFRAHDGDRDDETQGAVRGTLRHSTSLDSEPSWT